MERFWQINAKNAIILLLKQFISVKSAHQMYLSARSTQGWVMWLHLQFNLSLQKDLLMRARTHGSFLKLMVPHSMYHAPSDLPIGSKVQVTGFDEKHGLLLKCV